MKLHDKIVSLIPSAGLRQAITKNNIELSDIALLATAFSCAPDFDARIDYLKQLSKQFEGEIKEYTNRIIALQQQMLDEFSQSDSGTVFELYIKDSPEVRAETYICSSLNSALKLIDIYYDDFDITETEFARYTVKKRAVFSVENGSCLDCLGDDSVGEMVLLAGKRIFTVDMWDYRAEDCCGCCNDCESLCIQDLFVIPYPIFFKHGDAVKYRDDDGATCFGVILRDHADTTESSIIPLDSTQIIYRDFKNAHYAHTHIPLPFIDVISPAELPDELRDNYFEFVEYLNNHPLD